MLTLENLESETRALGERVIAPITKSVDEDGRFPAEAYSALRKEGFMGLLVPKEFGGLGGGDVHHAKTCWILAGFDATTALCYMMHNVATSVVAKFGSKELQNEILPKVAKGEIAIALAYSESGSGTHFDLPDMTEQEAGDCRILNGRKSFVTSAEFADYYLTYTNSCKLKGKRNNWLVERNSQNLVHEHNLWNGVGMRGNNSKPVQYNGVKVPLSRLVGVDGQGEDQAGLVAMYFITGLGAIYAGLGNAAYTCVLAHTKERKYTNGNALCDHEIVRAHLATLYTKAQSARALVLEAARSFDSGEADAATKIFACRVNATELVTEICSLAMRLGGGKAYSKLLPLERYLRDSFAGQVMAPSLDVVKMWLGDALRK